MKDEWGELHRRMSARNRRSMLWIMLYRVFRRRIRTTHLVYPALLFQSVAGAIALSLPPERGLVVWSIGNFVLVGLILIPVSFRPKRKAGEYSDFINDLRTPKRRIR